VASAIVTLAFFMLFAGQAIAGEVHSPVGVIGAPGAGNGQLALKKHSGVVVNVTTGNIYVSDTGNHRIQEFEPDGTFVRTFAPAGVASFSPTSIALDNSGGSNSGDLYVLDSSTSSVYKFHQDGSEVTEWVPKSGGGFAGKLTVANLLRVALDPDGDIWLGTDRDASSVRAKFLQYDSTGNPISSFETFVSPTEGLSFDNQGHLLVSDGGAPSRGSIVAELDSSGVIKSERVVSLPGPLTTDHADGSLFIVSESSSYIEAFAQDCGKPTKKAEEEAEKEGKVAEYHRCGSGQGPGREPLETFARGELSDPQGMGLGPGHLLYVAEAGTSTITVWAPEFVVPPTASIDEPSGTTATSVHVSGQINPNAPEGFHPTYKVAWRFDCYELRETDSGVTRPSQFNCGANTGQLQGELPADAVSHTVEGTIEGLKPGTKYEILLVGENAANTVESGTTLTTLAAPPTVDAVYAKEVTSSEVTFYAEEVNPRGAETNYYFEYVPQAAFESEGFGGPQTKTTAVGTLPVDNRGKEVSARVDGLQLATPYAFRFRAQNEKGLVTSQTGFFSSQTAFLPPVGSCPNEGFRVGLGMALPNCRAYELATPVDKGGLNAEGWPDLLRASAGGAGEEPAVTFYSQGGSGIPASGGGHQEFTSLLASRHSGVWSTQRLLPPEEVAEDAVFLGASSNLRYTLLAGRTGSKVTLFWVDTSTEESRQIAQAKTETFNSLGVDAISSDGSWAYFESTAPLDGVTGAKTGFDNVYRWDRESGKVSVVGILPAGEGGKAPPQGSFGGAYNWQAGNTASGGAIADLYVEAINAVSPDGDQLYFTAGKTGLLYLRKGLAGSAPTTARVSAPAAGATPSKQRPAAFQEATPSGSFAFFLSAQALTDDAHSPSAEEAEAELERMNLYRWNAASETVVDLAPADESFNLDGPDVRGVLGVAADGSSGYFVAKGALAPGGTLGQNNIYRFAGNGSEIQLTFVATLGNGFVDSANWSSTSYAGRTITNYGGKTARVAPNGDEVVFSSTAPLTGYDNRGCGETGTERCVEIFRYSASADDLTCISCDPTGARAAGSAELTTTYMNAQLTPAVAPTPILTRNISADGTRVFFQTPDSLVARDQNGPPNCTYREHQIHNALAGPRCLDVYEWEAVSEAPDGPCTEATSSYSAVAKGCVYLLSTGTSAEASYFVDASSDGDDVFIATTSQTVPVDRDDLYDVYDVRIGGGLSSQQALPPVPCKSSESCRGTPDGPPVTSPSPGSSTFQGQGNVVPEKHRPCKKGAKKCNKKKKSKNRKSRGHHHKSSSKSEAGK
jgi:hypothetical protein